METNKSEIQRLSTLDNAINILLTLGNQNSKSIRELGEELGISKSVLHRILQTFELRGFVKQDVKTMKYSLGYMILELSNALKESYELRNIAYPLMEQLRNLSGETIQLAIQENEKILILETIDGTKELRMFSQPGKTYPLTYGNFGKVFLSGMNNEEILSLINKYPLKKYASNSIIDLEQFLKSIEKVESNGMSIGIDDPIEGAYSMAAPIYNHREEIIASIALAGVKTPQTIENLEKVEKLTRETALDISKKLGYSNNLI